MSGIMTALNVPNAVNTNAPGSSNYASTVTTSFEGEIIDLRNHTLWTRSSGPEPWPIRSQSSQSTSTPSYPSSSSMRRPAESVRRLPASWLASNGLVDKTTDLEYWAKVDAFAMCGASAEKEICRIAREGKWTPASRNWMDDPREYVLMRWKGKFATPLPTINVAELISSIHRSRTRLHRLRSLLFGPYYFRVLLYLLKST